MKCILISAALIAMAGAASAQPTAVTNTEIGAVLASSGNGLTLYTFRNDRAGRSTCVGGCAQSWPPFLAGANPRSNDGSKLIRRADGSRQWANAAGMPLYFWAGDSAPGQTSGDGVGGVWDAARP
ncbi:hypothetical protein [Aliiroseovarius sp. YM-037]|uniref:COG4315 family predicted lipoprotein n=1 Tax=Aliiroseovarius sp. YM-037 TaxID=3341728 RepID=UPI003A7FF550